MRSVHYQYGCIITTITCAAVVEYWKCTSERCLWMTMDWWWQQKQERTRERERNRRQRVVCRYWKTQRRRRRTKKWCSSRGRTYRLEINNMYSAEGREGGYRLLMRVKGFVRDCNDVRAHVIVVVARRWEWPASSRCWASRYLLDCSLEASSRDVVVAAPCRPPGSAWARKDEWAVLREEDWVPPAGDFRSIQSEHSVQQLLIAAALKITDSPDTILESAALSSRYRQPICAVNQSGQS